MFYLFRLHCPGRFILATCPASQTPAQPSPYPKALKDERELNNVTLMATDFVQCCLKADEASRQEANSILDAVSRNRLQLAQTFCMTADGSGMTPLHAAAKAHWPNGGQETRRALP